MTVMAPGGTYPREEVTDSQIEDFDKAVHCDLVRKWWAGYYHGDVFPEQFIPENGVIIIYKAAPVASCFIYINETKFCHIGFCMADPALGAGRKVYFLRQAVSGAIQKAKRIVGEDALIWSLTDHAVVGRVYQEQGFECLGEGDLFAYCENSKDIEFLR